MPTQCDCLSGESFLAAVANTRVSLKPMKAVFCEILDGPDALVLRAVAEPGPPGPEEIQVAIEARGVAFTDVLMSKGESIASFDVAR